MPLQSFKSGLIAGGTREQRRKTDRFSSGLSSRSGTIRDDEEPSDDFSKAEKSTLSQEVEKYSGRRLLGQLGRAQAKGLRFWRTRSNAVIVFNFVPGRLHLQGDFSKKGTNFI